MTADEYLQNLITRDRVVTGDGSAASNAGNTVYQIVKRWADQYLRKGSYSGLYAKGTAIRGRTDADIFVSLKSDTLNTPKEIFDGLYIAGNHKTDTHMLTNRMSQSTLSIIVLKWIWCQPFILAAT